MLLALFIAGVVQDAVNGWYIRAIADGQRKKAATLAALGTILSYLAFTEIVNSAQLAGILAYALGNGIGTLMSVSAPTASRAG